MDTPKKIDSWAMLLGTKTEINRRRVLKIEHNVLLFWFYLFSLLNLLSSQYHFNKNQEVANKRNMQIVKTLTRTKAQMYSQLLQII